MGLLDRVKHTAVQTVNDRVFTLSTVTNFESIPNNSSELPVVIADDAGNYAVCEGSYSGNTLTVDFIEGGSAGKNMPTFTGSIEVFVALGSRALNRDRQGVAGLVYAGQSNATGWTTGYDPLIDFDDPRVTQYKFNYDPVDPRGTNYDPNEVLLHKEPVFFNAQTDNGANNVGSHGHFGKWLANNGHRNVRVLPCAEGGTSFTNNHWTATTGDLAIRTRDMIVSFINESEDHYLGAFVWAQGESDAYFGVSMSSATYTTYFDNFWSWLVSQVKALTTRSYDMEAEGVPLLVVGMPQQFLDSAFYTGTVQDSLVDIPNRINWSAFVDVSAYTGADTLHHDAPTQRTIGRELLPVAYKAARKNFDPNNVTDNSNITTSLNVTEQPDTLTASTTVTGGGTLISGSLNVTEEPDTLTASSTVTDPAPSETPLTDAIGVDLQLRKNRGITADGSNRVSQWDDYSGNNRHAVQGTTANMPTEVTGGKVDCEQNNDHFLRVPGFNLDDANGFTVIIRFQVNAGNAGTVFSDERNLLYWTASTTDCKTYGDTSVKVVENNNGSEIVLEWWTDGSTASFDIDGVSKVSNQAITTSGTASSDLFIGTFNNILYHGDATFSDIIVKKGTPMSESERNQIISEFI